jgi:hypothetical protein
MWQHQTATTQSSLITAIIATEEAEGQNCIWSTSGWLSRGPV